MDCREMRTLLTAFHDRELPAADRARVEEHLHGCPDCAALLADLARVDRAAGVPDPGPGYWDRFNARVMDRVEREAVGPKGTVLRPKGGWVRQQFRYLVPAAVAAALVVGIVRYSGMPPGPPTPTAMDGLVPERAGTPRVLSPRPAVPPGASERAPQDSAGQRMAKVEPASPPLLANDRFAAVTREERERLADRPLPAGGEEASRDRASAPAAISAPSPPSSTTSGGTASPMAEQPAPTAMDGQVPRQPWKATDSVASAGKEKSVSRMRAAKEPSPDGHGRPGAGTGRDATGSVAPAGSPCELARTLAGRDRFREAETAQRACLAKDRSAPAQEKGLVFLAELLDRQERFAEADAVITEVDGRFPQSRPLELYRQRRPMVQKQPVAVPVGTPGRR